MGRHPEVSAPSRGKGALVVRCQESGPGNDGSSGVRTHASTSRLACSSERQAGSDIAAIGNPTARHRQGATVTLTSQSFLRERRSTAPAPATRQAGSGCVYSRRVHARLSDVGSRPHPPWLIAPVAHRLGFDHWLVEANGLGGKPPVTVAFASGASIGAFRFQNLHLRGGAGHRHLLEVPALRCSLPFGSGGRCCQTFTTGANALSSERSRGSSTYPRERVFRSFP